MDKAAIESYLGKHPLDDELMAGDLNPHLVIIEITKAVTEIVIDYGFPCTEQDVMLFWLTKNVVFESVQRRIKQR